MSDQDVVIIGGGPAGSTVASILLKHRPTAKVTLLERTPHPRFHVGETLVTEINRVLDEMGVYPAIDKAGFIRKYGATFLWGNEGKLWNMIFGEIAPLQRDAAHLHHVQTNHAWHVDRAVYDETLLRHAGSLGATVREEVEVVDLLKDGDRVCGVVLKDGEQIRARYVVDATGQASLLGSSKDRVLDKRLRNVAVWGYYKGFDLTDEHNGKLDNSRAFIVSHPYGWSWMFPIRDDLMSVGVVSRLDWHNDRQTREPEAFFREAVASSPEMSKILSGATQVRYEEGGPMVYRIADFSYTSKSIVQPGLIRVGDAAGFIDPILSLGCFLGQSFGRYLAYALNTALSDDARVDPATALTAYEQQYRETLDVFREVTYFFYRFNARPDEWWQEARKLVSDAGFPTAASDKQAFVAFACGFAARRSVFREPTSVFDEPFFVDAFRALVGPEGAPELETVRLADDDRVRLRGPATLSQTAVPVDGKGLLAPALRVHVTLPDDSPELAFVRRINVPVSMAPLFGLIDGTTPVAALGDKLADAMGVATAHRPSVHKYVRTVLTDLVQRGLAERAPASAVA